MAEKALVFSMPQEVLLMVKTGNMKSEGITEAVTISMRSGAWNPAITATNNKFVLKLKYSITHFTMRKKTTTKSKQQVKAVEPKMTMPCRITIRLTEEQMKQVANNAALKGHKPSAYCRQVILGRKVRDLSPDTRSFRQTPQEFYVNILNQKRVTDCQMFSIKELNRSTVKQSVVVHPAF